MAYENIDERREHLFEQIKEKKILFDDDNAIKEISVKFGCSTQCVKSDIKWFFSGKLPKDLTLPAHYAYKKGYVYMLSNKHMPYIVKIGRTEYSAKDRAESLYTTAIPTPFVVEFEIMVSDTVGAETAIFRTLDNLRVSERREFFEINESILCMKKMIIKAVEEYL